VKSKEFPQVVAAWAARRVPRGVVGPDFFIGTSESEFGPGHLDLEVDTVAGGPSSVAGEAGQSTTGGAPAYAGRRSGAPPHQPPAVWVPER
jgi:hypothetical protein